MLPVVLDRIVRRNRARIANIEMIRKRMLIRASSDPFQMSEGRFIELFRLNKRLARHLINLVELRLQERLSLKGISTETKVLCALRFYAVGSYQRGTGQDFNCGLSQTTVHRCIHAVTRILSNLADEYIVFPTTRLERNAIKFEFMNKWNFPGTVGAIDCFHVSILKPTVDEHNFINRKGYHSINVQIVCDHKLKIRNLFANYGGSTHDSFIWRQSQVQQYMSTLHHNNESCWLIGDCGYPLQPYLLTPFRNPQQPQEERYNRTHAQARNCIERCIGVLKMRFRCLHTERSARYDPKFMCLVIKVCGILHNMCIEENLEFEEEVPDVIDNDVVEHNDNVNNVVEGMRVRENVVNRYFL